MDSLDLDSLSIKDSDYLDCLDKNIQGQQDYTEDMDINNEQDIADFKNIGVSSYSDTDSDTDIESQTDEPNYNDTQDFEQQTGNQPEFSEPDQTVPEFQPEPQTTDSQEQTIYTQSQVSDVRPDCSPYQNYINNYGNKEDGLNSATPGEAPNQSQDGLDRGDANPTPASPTPEQNPAASTDAASVPQNQQGNNNNTQDNPAQNVNNQPCPTASPQSDNTRQGNPVNTGKVAETNISDNSDTESEEGTANINLSVSLNPQNLIKLASVVGIAIVLLLIIICFTPKEEKEIPVKTKEYKTEEMKTGKTNNQLDMFLERTNTEDYGKVDEEVKEKGEGNKSSRFKTLDELTVYVENKTATLLSEEKMLKNQYDNGDITREKFESDLKGYIKEVDVLSHLLSLNKGEYSDEGKGDTYDELSNNIASLTAYGDTLLYTD